MKTENPIDAWFVSDSGSLSDNARQRLVEAGVNFRELQDIKVQGVDTIPAIISLEGNFEGVERIEEYFEIIGNRPRVS